MVELLGCPFCGKDSVKIDDHSDPLGACFRIDHWCGGTVGGNFIAVEQDSEQDVAREWNRRADLARPSQAGDERVARLKTALREIAAMATPSANATVRRMAATALAAMDTPKGGGDE